LGNSYKGKKRCFVGYESSCLHRLERYGRYVFVRDNRRNNRRVRKPIVLECCIEYFLIFDAKYYNIQIEKNKHLRGNPGVSDVTKQYLYQLAYKRFIEAHGIARVKNFFIMPTEKDYSINKGFAKMKMLEALGLENIQVLQLPATVVYECYLSKRKMSITDFGIDI